MNTIEKAKAYDEALERAKKLTSDLTTLQAIREFIFPELKESEDERIRKEAISIVQSYMNICDKEGDPCLSGYKVLAYLEKQKELLTPEEKMNHPLYLEGFDVGRKVGQVEAEQKPAWSEEDEDMFVSVLHFLNTNRINERGKVITWVESLPKRFSLQPKQEWSEEDESILEALIYDIERLPMQGVLTHRSCDSYIKFLKALRPGWKPTQAQMSMLLAVINDPNNAGAESCQLALREIYRQLKKL